MENEILTAEEAAAYLKTNVEAVVDLLDSHVLRGRKIDGSWRTTKRAITCLVEGTSLEVVCCPPGECCPPSGAAANAMSGSGCGC